VKINDKWQRILFQFYNKEDDPNCLKAAILKQHDNLNYINYSFGYENIITYVITTSCLHEKDSIVEIMY